MFIYPLNTVWNYIVPPYLQLFCFFLKRLSLLPPLSYPHVKSRLIVHLFLEAFLTSSELMLSFRLKLT